MIKLRVINSYSFFMQKFRDLHFTYERLKSEIETKKKETIKITHKLNDKQTEYNELKFRHESLQNKINEDKHNLEVDLRNRNKEFVESLNRKQEELWSLQRKLNWKEREIVEKNNKLLEEESRIERIQKELSGFERKLDTRDRKIKKKESDLVRKEEDINNSVDVINADILDKQNILDDLELQIWSLRDERITIKHINSKEREDIEKRLMILEETEKRIDIKREQMRSEMRVLENAKNNS